MYKKDDIRTYIDCFNREDRDAEQDRRLIPNKDVLEWMKEQIPFFDCPDPLLTEIYYFRWWTYRKHIRGTPEGYVITEFLPDVPWAGPYNTISCALGHHFDEGRWLADRQPLSDYARFWLTGSGKGDHALSYSHWLCTALYHFCLLSGDFSLGTELLDEMILYFEERRRRNTSGTLYWSDDDRDGMEYTISGKGLRPTLNSYLCSDAYALSRFAEIAGKPQLSEKYSVLHRKIKADIQKELWNPELSFYVTLSGDVPEAEISKDVLPVREQAGFTPWCFGAADKRADTAWEMLMSPKHFFAPFGPTTADMADSRFMKTAVDHECLWDGPSWPFATSVTLGGLAAYLRTPGHAETVTKSDYYTLLHNYAASHFLTENGKRIHWIDENLHPLTGEWQARSILKQKDPSTFDRGMAYNHSTFCDLILSGLIGISPTEDGYLHLHPLTPDDWSYFSVEHLSFFGHNVGIYWDKNGTMYNYPAGLTVTLDNTPIHHAPSLGDITLKIRKENCNG